MSGWATSSITVSNLRLFSALRNSQKAVKSRIRTRRASSGASTNMAISEDFVDKTGVERPDFIKAIFRFQEPFETVEEVAVVAEFDRHKTEGEFFGPRDPRLAEERFEDRVLSAF